MIVIIEIIKIIDDLIELKFEKILIDLNVLWFDDFIWNDLIKLIANNDFLKFCAVFVVSNLTTDLNWFLMIMFNLICILTVWYLYQFSRFLCFHQEVDWFVFFFIH